MKIKKIIFFLISLTLIGLGIAFLSSKGAINFPIRRYTPPENVSAARYLHTAPGFTISVLARDLDKPRFMRLTARGDLLVSEPSRGRILLLKTKNHGDGKTKKRILIDGLNKPHGLDIVDGWLYIAETDAVGRVRFDIEKQSVQGQYTRIARLPSGLGHWTRTLRVGPDNQVYVSVGSSCNVCEETATHRAALLQMDLEGHNVRVYASGLRNSVGFAWDRHGALYATDNGRDWLGDDFPPDELNRIESGGFYGWPIAHGMRTADPTYGVDKDEAVARSIAPVFLFKPHNAPLGITFLHDKRFPAAYQDAAIVALHGSWNSSSKVGYKVIALHWQDDGSIVARDFITGFLTGEGKVLGRPVDVVAAPGGILYLSDDFAGVIYRVSVK